MKTRSHRTPSYCLHKATGQAVVRINGKDYYLGKYDTFESRSEYDRLIAEWLAGGRSLAKSPEASDITINELLLDYLTWAKGHYIDADGKQSHEIDNINIAVRHLRLLYGLTPARQFGPLALRSLQQELARSGLCRNVVNARINRIRRFFKWAVSFERLPASVLEALKTVAGLQRGRGQVKESKPIESIPVEVIDATIPFMPAPVAALVRLQLLDGARPSENLSMRGIDLDMSKEVWEYRPEHHKNKYRGKDRIIPLGPQAQEIIKPFLKDDPQEYLFSPREYVEAMHAKRAARRRSKRTPSQLRRKRKAQPKRKPAELYNRRSYYYAVIRAIDKANKQREKDGLPPLPHWSPLRVRHTAGTIIRAKFGVEASRVILGHTRIETSQIYAERDMSKAAEIIKKIG